MKGAVSGSCNVGKCTYDSPLAVATCDPGKKKVLGTIHILRQHSFEIFMNDPLCYHEYISKIGNFLDPPTQFFC